MRQRHTVNSLITHTPRWTAQGMGYEGVWALRAGPKMTFEKLRKNQDNSEKNKSCVFITKKKCYFWSHQDKFSCWRILKVLPSFEKWGKSSINLRMHYGPQTRWIILRYLVKSLSHPLFWWILGESEWGEFHKVVPGESISPSTQTKFTNSKKRGRVH